MTPIKDAESFCAHYMKLLPESDPSEVQKLLEMKSVRRAEQVPIIDRYRAMSEAYAKQVALTEKAEVGNNPLKRSST